MKSLTRLASGSLFLLLLASCAPVPTTVDDKMAADEAMPMEDEDVDTMEEESADQDQANSAMAEKADTDKMMEADIDEEDAGEDSADDQGEDSVMEDDAMMDDKGMMKEDDKMMEDDTAMEPRVIHINVKNWEFEPATIELKKGEKVVLELSGEGGNHGIAIPGLGVNEVVANGDTILIELPTDVAGTFDAFCNVPCGPGHKDMKAKIVIS